MGVVSRKRCCLFCTILGEVDIMEEEEFAIHLDLFGLNNCPPKDDVFAFSDRSAVCHD